MPTDARSRARATQQASRALAAALGGRFAPHTAVAGRLSLPMVRHDSGVELVLIPGGSVRIGLSAAERKALVASMRTPDGRDAAVELAHACVPCRTVRIATFLCARAPIVRDGSIVLASAAEAGRIAKRLGLRLLSEAEWEYVARDGTARAWIGVDDVGGDVLTALARHAKSMYGRVAPPVGVGADRFGVWGMASGDWVADAWHDDYRGAPRSGAPWAGGSTPGVRRGGAASLYPWQDADEHLEAHCAMRMPATKGTFACVRLAFDVPPGLAITLDARGAERPAVARAPARSSTPKRAATPRKPRASTRNDPQIVAKIEALGRAIFSPKRAAEVRVGVDCYRTAPGRYEAKVLVVVRARTRERAFGERARGDDRDGALRALVAKLEAMPRAT